MGEKDGYMVNGTDMSGCASLHARATMLMPDGPWALALLDCLFK